MEFNSLPFLILVISTYLLCMIVKDNTKQKIILLVASFVFYAYWDVRFLTLMIAEIAVSFTLALRMNGKHRKCLLITSVTFVLLILFVFKYFNFFIDSLVLLSGTEINFVYRIALPIGISFYSFQCISYLVDVYRGETKARVNILDYALFISFFPQLVAGPIMRSKDFLPQLDSRGVSLSKRNLSEGCQIFVQGLVKKVVIADRLAVCVDSVFATPKAYSGISIMCAAVAYAMQILCDFSGYSDMAIGTAKVFGFDLCQNFNLPYLSSNPSEFWRRWHISLSQWLRDYLYIPLGGNRKGSKRTYNNLMITMILGGLWHGASWNFVVWGAIHGLALCIHRGWKGCTVRNIMVNEWGRGYKAISIAVTGLFITLSWVIFRLDSIEKINTVFYRMFTLAEGVKYVSVYSVAFFMVIVIYYLGMCLRHGGNSHYEYLDLTSFWGLVGFLLAIGVIAIFGYTGNNAFIYFQF